MSSRALMYSRDVLSTRRSHWPDSPTASVTSEASRDTQYCENKYTSRRFRRPQRSSSSDSYSDCGRSSIRQRDRRGKKSSTGMMSPSARRDPKGKGRIVHGRAQATMKSNGGRDIRMSHSKPIRNRYVREESELEPGSMTTDGSSEDCASVSSTDSSGSDETLCEGRRGRVRELPSQSAPLRPSHRNGRDPFKSSGVVFKMADEEWFGTSAQIRSSDSSQLRPQSERIESFKQVQRRQAYDERASKGGYSYRASQRDHDPRGSDDRSGIASTSSMQRREKYATTVEDVRSRLPRGSRRRSRDGSLSSQLSDGWGAPESPDETVLDRPLQSIFLIYPLRTPRLRYFATERTIRQMMADDRMTEACELTARAMQERRTDICLGMMIEAETLIARSEFFTARNLLESQYHSSFTPLLQFAKFQEKVKRSLLHLNATYVWWQRKLEEESMLPDWCNDEKEILCLRRFLKYMETCDITNYTQLDFLIPSYTSDVLGEWIRQLKQGGYPSDIIEGDYARELLSYCEQGCPIALAIIAAEAPERLSEMLSRVENNDHPSVQLLTARYKLTRNVLRDEDDYNRCLRSLRAAFKCGLRDAASDYCMTWKNSEYKALQEVHSATGMLSGRVAWSLAAGTDENFPLSKRWPSALRTLRTAIKHDLSARGRFVHPLLALVGLYRLREISEVALCDIRRGRLEKRRASLQKALNRAILLLLDASQRKNLAARQKLRRIMDHGEYQVPFPKDGEETYRLVGQYYSQETSRITDINWHNVYNPFPSFDQEFNHMCDWERQQSIDTSFLCLKSRVDLFYERNPQSIQARILKACIPPTVDLKDEPPVVQLDIPIDVDNIWSRNVHSAMSHVQEARGFYKSSQFDIAFECLASALIQSDAAVSLSRQTMLDLLRHTQYYRSVCHLKASVTITSIHLFLRLRRHSNTILSFARNFCRVRTGGGPQKSSHQEQVAAILDIEGDLFAILGYFNKARVAWEEAQDLFWDPRRSLKIIWEEWKSLVAIKRDVVNLPPDDPGVSDLTRRIRSEIEKEVTTFQGSPLKRDYYILLAFLTLQRVPMSDTIRWIKIAVAAERECIPALRTARPIEMDILLELQDDFSCIREDDWKSLTKAKLIGHARVRTFLSYSATVYACIDPILLESATYEMGSENLKLLQRRRPLPFPPPTTPPRNTQMLSDRVSVSTRVSSSSSRQ